MINAFIAFLYLFCKDKKALENSDKKELLDAFRGSVDKIAKNTDSSNVLPAEVMLPLISLKHLYIIKINKKEDIVLDFSKSISDYYGERNDDNLEFAYKKACNDTYDLQISFLGYANYLKSRIS